MDIEDKMYIEQGLLAIDDNINEAIDENSPSKQIEKFIEDLYNLRKEGIAKNGEYSLENLVFKEFRNLGYLDHLKELKNNLVSKELSLEGLNEALNIDYYNTLEKLKELAASVEEEGTYSLVDGELVSDTPTNGYQVSFFRPEITNEHIKAITKLLGYKVFGQAFLGLWKEAPEISYRLYDKDNAFKLAEIFNQEAIWDNKNNKPIKNKKFNKKKKIDYSKAIQELKEFIKEFK